MSYLSMWVMKPNPGKSQEAQETLKKMCSLWKKHGALEAHAAILFGGYYGHLGLNVRCESMEHYGKCNDSLNADPEVQKTLSEGDMLGEVVRHTLARRFTD